MTAPALLLLLSAVGPALVRAPEAPAQQPAPIPFEHVIIDRDVPEQLPCKSVGDIDGDGFPDIILGGHFKGGNLVWYHYPDWGKHVIHQGQCAVDMQVGDVDRDGDLDVIVPDDYQGRTGGKTLVWYENPRPKGNPAADQWKRHIVTSGAPVDDYIHDVEVGDVNRDGKLDLVVRHGKTVLYLQDSPDSWGEKVLDTGTGAGDEEGTTLADLNRDGRLDVVLNGYWLEGPADPVKGTWVKHDIDPHWPHLVGVAVADVNKDRRPDVLLAPAEEHGRLSWYEGPRDPANGRWEEHVIDADVIYIHTFKVADVDLDGDLDVVTAEMHASGYHPDKPSRRRISLYLNGDKGLTWTQQVVATTGAHNLRVADIDSDGDIDIIGANWSGPHPVELWRNRLDPRSPHLRPRQSGLPPKR
jgi:hypothetical protein